VVFLTCHQVQHQTLLLLAATNNCGYSCTVMCFGCDSGTVLPICGIKRRCALVVIVKPDSLHMAQMYFHDATFLCNGMREITSEKQQSSFSVLKADYSVMMDSSIIRIPSHGKCLHEMLLMQAT